MLRSSYAGFVVITVLLFVFVAGNCGFWIEGAEQRKKVTANENAFQIETANEESYNYCSITIAGNSFSNPAVPLDYSSESFIELCVIDSSNRKTGYDYSSKRLVKAIPDCFYNEDGLSSSDPGYPPGPLVKLIKIQSPYDGNYNLQVIGKHIGGYEINLNTVDQNQNDRDIWKKIRRITSPGTIHSYEICYYRDDVNKFTITKKVTPRELQGSLQTAFKLTWIDDKIIQNDLVAKIGSADSACKQDNNDSAINILQSFIKDVEATKGRHIAGTAADILIDDAKSLIRLLSSSRSGR